MRICSKHLIVLGLAIAMAGILTAARADAQGDSASDFSWSMPNRFGNYLGNARLLAYPQTAAEVDSGPFAVDFTLPNTACRPGVLRRWSVEQKRVPAERLGEGCNFRLWFEREGAYPVRLELEGGEQDDSSSEQMVVVQDLLILGIGDSVASGEGNPDNGNLVDPTWQNKRCHRSALAGTARAAALVEAADPRSSVTFVHLACSGGTVPRGLTGGYRGIQAGLFPRPRLLPPQLDEVELIDRKREIDAVLLSVGANDIGFAKIVTFCIPRRPCYEKRIRPQKLDLPAGPNVTLNAALTAALAQLPERYRQVDSRLPDDLPRDRVYAVEYFDALHATPDTLCNSILGGVEREEIEWAYDSVLVPLNDQVRRAADTHGWKYVSAVADAFAGHGYCTGADRWVRRLDESLWRQGLNPSGTLHPSDEGHRQTSLLIATQLRKALLPNGAAREPRDRADQADQMLAAGVVPGVLPVDAENGGGVPWWVWLLGGLALLAVAAAVVAVVAARRRGSNP